MTFLRRHALPVAFAALLLLSLLLPSLVARFTPTGTVLLQETFTTERPGLWTSSPAAAPPTNGVLTLTAPPRCLISTVLPAPLPGTYLRWSARAAHRDITVGKRRWMYARADLVPIIRGYTHPDWHAGCEPVHGIGDQPMQWHEDIFLVPEQTESLFIRLFNGGDTGTFEVDELLLEEVRPAILFRVLRLPLYLAWGLLALACLKRYFPRRCLRGWLAIGAAAAFLTLCLIPAAAVTNLILRPLSGASDAIQKTYAATASHAKEAPSAVRPSTGQPISFPWDKVGHAGFIFMVTILFAAWFPHSTFPHTGAALLPLLIAVTLGLSISSELLQNLSLMRTLSLQDLMADSIGIAAALPLALLLFRTASKTPGGCPRRSEKA